MFGLTKKILIGILTDLVNESNHTKCVSLSNQKCMIQPTLINLHSNEYNQEFNISSFVIKSDQIDVLEVVILLITYLIKYVFQVKQKI